MAAKGGHINEIYNYGVLNEKGEGVPEDIPQAIHYFEMAADDDFPPALFKMGYYCQNGIALSKDLPLAAELFKKGADLGFQECIYAYGATD